MSFSAMIQAVRAGGSFNPAQIAGFVLDLDGDKGITIATGVSAWADQYTPPTYDFSQTASGQQPAYTANDSNLNNHGSVNLDGASSAADNLVSASTDPLQMGSGFHLALVGKFTPPASSFKYIAGKWSGSTANRYWLLRLYSSGTLQALLRDSADSSWQAYVTTAILPPGGVSSIQFGWDSAAGTGILRIGSIEETWSVPTVYTSGTTQPMTLGRASSDSVQVDLARVLGYEQSVSSSNRDKLTNYLESNYNSFVFDPSQIAGLSLDLDGDLGITLATGVSAWADQSGSANDATQANTTKQPSYTASDASFNGHGSLTFDGVDDFLLAADSVGLRADLGMTLFIVAYTSTSGVDQTLAGKVLGTSRDYYVQTSSVGKLGLITRDSADTTWSSVQDGIANDGVAHVLRTRYDGATTIGAAVDGVETTNAVTDVGTSTAGLGIGARSDGVSPAAVTIARILMWPKELTTFEMASVESYLTTKYGL